MTLVPPINEWDRPVFPHSFSLELDNAALRMRLLRISEIIEETLPSSYDEYGYYMNKVTSLSPESIEEIYKLAKGIR